MNPMVALLFLPGLIVGLTVHEFAHAYGKDEDQGEEKSCFDSLCCNKKSESDDEDQGEDQEKSWFNCCSLFSKKENNLKKVKEEKKSVDYKYITFGYNFIVGSINSVKFHEALNETT